LITNVKTTDINIEFGCETDVNMTRISDQLNAAEPSFWGPSIFTEPPIWSSVGTPLEEGDIDVV
jgi:hypothetical protein